jgi:hypothetical protein
MPLIAFDCAVWFREEFHKQMNSTYWSRILGISQTTFGGLENTGPMSKVWAWVWCTSAALKCNECLWMVHRSEYEYTFSSCVAFLSQVDCSAENWHEERRKDRCFPAHTLTERDAQIWILRASNLMLVRVFSHHIAIPTIVQFHPRASDLKGDVQSPKALLYCLGDTWDENNGSCFEGMTIFV